MEIKSSFVIPYRLETCEAISEAMREDLIGIGGGYKDIYKIAQNLSLNKPPALRNACLLLKKDFYILRKEKLREVDNIQIRIANLDLISSFPVIEKKISWAKEISESESILHFLAHFSLEVQRDCKVSPFPVSPTEMLESQISINRFIKHEILAYASSKKGRRLNPGELRKLIVAGTLFDVKNGHVLHALRISDKHRKGEMLYQNASAELLFSRVPAYLGRIIKIDPKTIRQRLFSKIEHLGLPVKQKTTLFGYFSPDIHKDDLLSIIDKIDLIAKKIVRVEISERLHEYISSIKFKIACASSIYKEMFLSPELEQMQKFYIPQKILQSTVAYRNSIIDTYTRVDSLEFYPTKDYLDLWKGAVSDDCTRLDLGEEQLKTPSFFNIRIFKDFCWIGNIYMLDFTKEYGVLLVDRIQIPRGIDADYINFFDHLKEIFKEMFSAVEYKKILVPLSISNHASLQEVFNKYREKLQREEIGLSSKYAKHFESLRLKTGYYVLCNK